MSGHTPGPWFVSDAGCGCFDIADGWPNEHGEVDGCIATVWGNRPTLSATAHGDAALIASAPDLLAALRLVVSLLARASYTGSLYGRYDVDWMAMSESVLNVLHEAEGKVK